MDPDGSLNRNATPCGPLPADWKASRDGRHFCLVAPWTVKVVPPEGFSGTPLDESGASVSAPMVAGALAVVLHRFRGQIAPREAGRRLVNTADDTGPYANPMTHGAGLLDVEAAIRPIGRLSTGLAGREADLADTWLRAPAAWGNLAGRLRGVEVAAFDATNAPFWLDAAALVESGARREGGLPSALAADDRDDRPGTAAAFAWGAVPRAAFAPRGLRLEMGVKGEAPSMDGASVVNGVGLALRPDDGRGFGVGLAAEREAWLGGGSGGAFGEGVDGAMTWLRHEWRWTPDGAGRWLVDTDATLAVGGPRAAKGAMFGATRALYSSARVAVERWAGNAVTRLSLGQPLRAETGEGTFRTPVARTPEGERIYAERRVGLEPEGREIRIALERTRPWGLGRLGFGAEWIRESGHAPGEDDWSVGAVWRMAW